MAKISDLQMRIKKTGDESLLIEVDYDLSFFETEVELNIEFMEFVAVVSTDGESNIYDYNKFIELWWLPDKGTDELVNRIHQGSIKPGGKAKLHRRFEGELKNGDVHKYDQSTLKPFVLVNPQITPHLLVGE